jgi:hypothetical protein
MSCSADYSFVFWSGNADYYFEWNVPLDCIGALPPPLSPASVPLAPEPKGWAHSPAGEGWGSPNSDD